MKLGLYGGSFDPIHRGHIEPVREACRALKLDRVIYLPTANPPHKSQREVPALARYAMVELALLSETSFFVDPFELGPMKCFTVDTLEHFHKAQPEARLFLILGSDSFVRLDRWREWRRILRLAELAVLERPGTDAGELSPELEAALDNHRVHRIANLPVAASSTEVRQRIAAHSQDLHQLVPQPVLDYIAKYDLYR